MKTKRERIVSKALEILRSNPNGVRYSDLGTKIQKEFQKKATHIPINTNTIRGAIWDLETQAPKEVYKPARGLFRHVAFRDKEIDKDLQKPPSHTGKIKEGHFYKPFADWLINELEECTQAIPLGGNRFKDKWSTPDVIGKREPCRSDIIKTPTEIISAEVKVDSKDLITAFGQACSYKLFSHKSYIVIPKDSSQDDISKLDALCLIFGIGLVLFDNNNASDPQFEIRVRPLKHEPDMFYVNKCMRLIEKELFR